MNITYTVAGGTPANLNMRAATWDASPENGTVMTHGGTSEPLKVTQTFKTDGKVLDWTIDIEATTAQPVTIGNLSVTFRATGTGGATPAEIFEHGFTSHQYIEGNGSFVYYTRASGAPPFMLVTVRPGTHLEFTGGGGAGGTNDSGPQVCGASGEARHVAPAAHLTGASGGGPARQQGLLRLPFPVPRWLRRARNDLLQRRPVRHRVVPGMTVRRISRRCFRCTRKQRSSRYVGVPVADDSHALGEPQSDTHVYEVAFQKLGENKLTIPHDGGRETYLEFFVTEPMETLIKKRASFLVDRQQISDPTKWWNGVYGPYDMKAKKTRTIDDPDIFLDRMVYALTCDDPGLAKAPYLAAKNVTYPNKAEIESLEYYIKNFVVGRAAAERRRAAVSVRRLRHAELVRESRPGAAQGLRGLANGATAIADLNKEHVWRSYDYPHVVMLYFHMYQIAKRYPEMSTYLDAAGYLTRAWETARAFYTYPYEIYPSYYDTYKWGLYNELVVLELIDALDAEGFPDQATWLRQWEKKTKYFVYDDPYPFRRVRVRSHGVRVDLRVREVRRHARHAAGREPVVRRQAEEVVVASVGQARGLARVHGSPARVGPRACAAGSTRRTTRSAAIPA